MRPSATRPSSCAYFGPRRTGIVSSQVPRGRGQLDADHGRRHQAHCRKRQGSTIKLMNEAVRFAAGKRIVLYLSSTSLAQSSSDPLYLAAVQPDAAITIGRVTLKPLGAEAGRLPDETGPRSARRACLQCLPPARRRRGVTPTQIVLGATGPLSGSESAYCADAHRSAGVLRLRQRARRGQRPQDRLPRSKTTSTNPVNNRVADAEARRAGGRGSRSSTRSAPSMRSAVRDYLNARKVPQVFVGSGAAVIGHAARESTPGRWGLLPSFTGEGADLTGA